MPGRRRRHKIRSSTATGAAEKTNFRTSSVPSSTTSSAQIQAAHLKNRVRDEYDKIKRQREADAAENWKQNKEVIVKESLELDNKFGSKRTPSPWIVCKEPAATEKGHRLSKTKVTTVTESASGKVTTTKTRKVVINPVEPIPKANCWTYISRNYKVEDETSLRHLPHLGDGELENNDFYDELLDLYDSKLHSETDGMSIDDEILLQLVQVMTSGEEGEQCNGIRDITGSSGGRIKVPSQDICIAISEVLSGKWTAEDIKNKYSELIQEASEQYSPSIDGISSISLTRKQAMHSFSSLLCRRCCLFDCQLHRGEPDPSRPPPKASMRNEPDLEPNKSPCGSDCYLRWRKVKMVECFDEVSPDQRQIDNPVAMGDADGFYSIFRNIYCGWSGVEESLFRSIQKVFPGNYCVLSKILMSKSCRDVYLFAQNEERSRDEATLEATQERDMEEDSSSTSSGKKSSKPRTKFRDYYHHAHKIRKGQTCPTTIHFVPCKHPGEECGLSCYCILNGKPCEQFCHCSIACKNRFPGCACKGQCNGKQCPCYCDSRECVPDLCRSCTAHEHEESKIKCKNVCIQRGRHKHLLLGVSAVSGWGIFLQEAAKKHEYIGEYTGELITDSESDRRGKVYDAKKCSYLFALNNEYVLDATMKGNKLRFANHSAKNPNCYVKILKVNTDHRIGIFAKRDIAAQEELFFDYGKGQKGSWRKEFTPIERQIENGPTVVAPPNTRPQ